MSAPAVSTPLDIRELMVETVVWEGWLGFDGHAEPSYASAVTLPCYKEAHGLTQGGVEALRKADESINDPDWDLFFSGDLAEARTFTLWDRFTSNGVAVLGVNGQPQAINTVVGPNFDNLHPWLIVVVL